MRSTWIAMVVVAASGATAARAEQVDPHRLEPITADAKGSGDTAQVFATGVDADVLLYALDAGDFVMLAYAKPIDGRIGDATPVPARAAFAALAAGLDVVPLRRSKRAHAADIRVHGASALRMLEFLADVAGVSYVVALKHDLPDITINAHHVDAGELARAIAKLAKVEIIEANNGAWMIVEPGTKLDKRLVLKARTKARLEITHAHPGEARRLLEPDVDQDHNACPKDTWVDASLHGEVGVLEAVLASLPGPPCEQTPNHDELDTATATLVGIFVEPKARRAVFRVPHGARTFEPSGEQRVEINYVVLHPGEREPIGVTTPRALVAELVAPGPFANEDRAAWKLRATVRVGKAWRAVFRSKLEWRVAPGPGMFPADRDAPIDITAGTASAKPIGYALER